MSPLTSAMVLAAGFGTRMGDLTKDRPKPMLPVGGRPMIDLALDWIGDAGATRAVVNLHYLADQLRDHLQGRDRPEVLFSEEQPEILDTGGGLKQALPLLGDGPFFSLNSDAVFAGANPLACLTKAWNPDRMDALQLLVPVEQARAYTRAGDFFLEAEGGTPRRRGSADRAPLIYAGAQIVSPRVFDGSPDGAFSMNILWDRLAARGRLAAVTYPDIWVDVGTPEGLQAAEQALAEGTT